MFKQKKYPFNAIIMELTHRYVNNSYIELPFNNHQAAVNQTALIPIKKQVKNATH